MSASLRPWRLWVVQWDISHFAISLAFFAFTGMWMTASKHFGMIHIPRPIWYILWALSCLTAVVNLGLYAARAFLFPGAVMDDFRHPRLVNFFFAPVICGALLVLTAPDAVRSFQFCRVAFFVLGTYQVVLALYLYGEWLFGSKPTTVIHPLIFMQVIGFFLLANLGASTFLIAEARALFAVGALFWLLVFITNFQHVALALHNKHERPQPTFFLFIAPPAAAAIAMAVITAAEAAEDKSGMLVVESASDWGNFFRALVDIDLFLYLLIVRLFATFWRNKFSISWWAYIFPLSSAATAVIWRFNSEGYLFWGVLAAVLSVIATVAMVVVLCATGWALGTRRVPDSPAVLAAYLAYVSEAQAPVLPLPGANNDDQERTMETFPDFERSELPV